MRLLALASALCVAGCGAAWRANNPPGQPGVPSDWAVVDAVVHQVVRAAGSELPAECVPQCGVGLVCDEESGRCVPDPTRAPPEGGPRYR